jgi:putative tricarboxylic transport membrane protein
VGYLMIRFDYPRLTLVIALVLGDTAERSFHMTETISDYHMWSFMLGRPTAVILLASIVVTLCLPIARKLISRRGRQGV